MLSTFIYGSFLADKKKKQQKPCMPKKKGGAIHPLPPAPFDLALIFKEVVLTHSALEHIEICSDTIILD